MIVDVGVIVAVIGTVIVAALVNGNDAVSVADAVVATLARPEDGATQVPGLHRAESFTASIRSTISFPFTSAITVTGAITPMTTSTAT